MKKIYLLFLAVMLSAPAFSQLMCNVTYSIDTATNTVSFNYTQTQSNSVVDWSFGDGTAGSGTVVSHTYSSSGVYVACATEYDPITLNQLCQSCVSLSTSTIANCIFSANEVNPGNNSLLFFQSLVTPTTASITWDFGDGVVGAGRFINHQYYFTGTYTACMTAVNGSDTCVSCQQITVTDQPLGTCSFTYLPDPSNVNILTFTGSPLGTNSVITWDFGDGSAAIGTNPTHVFLAAGTYNVCMFETDASTGVDLCHVCLPVYVSQTPICTFSYSAIPGTVNTYNFIGYIIDSTNIASWDFGDGTVATGNQISHTYTTPGTYNICMYEVDTNPLTTMCMTCTTIVIGNSLCDANFTVVPFGLDAYFIDMSAGYSSATTYSWDFGDGSTSNLRFPTHTYSTPGTYNACLVVNNGFCADTMCQSLIVDSAIITPTFCQAFYVFTQLSPYQLAVVNLSSGTNLSFQWSFGDGTSSTAAYPIHTYSSAGSYQLCLTIADPSGCTSTYCDTLSVDSSGFIIYRGMNAGFTINVMSPDQLNGVKELSKDLSSNLYPNPASESIQINGIQELGNSIRYSIRNITGGVVQQGTLTNKSQTIGVQSLTGGVYILELRNEHNESSFARFVKQ